MIYVGDSTSTRHEDNSLHISGCKPQPHEYMVELDLKFTNIDHMSICWVYQVTNHNILSHARAVSLSRREGNNL